MQECLESGLDRGLGFDIREGDIILGNFEELDLLQSTTDGAIEAVQRRVSCHLFVTKKNNTKNENGFCDAH